MIASIFLLMGWDASTVATARPVTYGYTFKAI